MEGLISKPGGQAISRENLDRHNANMEAGPCRPRDFIPMDEQLNMLCEYAYNNCASQADHISSLAAGIGAKDIAERIFNRFIIREKELQEETDGLHGLQELSYRLKFYLRLQQWLNEQHFEVVERITNSRISIMEAIRNSEPKKEYKG